MTHSGQRTCSSRSSDLQSLILMNSTQKWTFRLSCTLFNHICYISSIKRFLHMSYRYSNKLRDPHAVDFCMRISQQFSLWCYTRAKLSFVLSLFSIYYAGLIYFSYHRRLMVAIQVVVILTISPLLAHHFFHSILFNHNYYYYTV